MRNLAPPFLRPRNLHCSKKQQRRVTAGRARIGCLRKRRFYTRAPHSAGAPFSGLRQDLAVAQSWAPFFAVALLRCSSGPFRVIPAEWKLLPKGQSKPLPKGQSLRPNERLPRFGVNCHELQIQVLPRISCFFIESYRNIWEPEVDWMQAYHTVITLLSPPSPLTIDHIT